MTIEITALRSVPDGAKGVGRDIRVRWALEECVISTLDPAGPLTTGSFGADDPSRQELVRRAKLAKGTW
jgi:hypothetical protein